MSSLHPADAAFTKKGSAGMGPAIGGSFAGASASASLEFVSAGAAPSSIATAPPKRTSRTADILNPLYCSACDKVFAKETVFHAHKSGKKHRNAIKAMDLAEDEADAGSAPLPSKRPAEPTTDEPASKRLAAAPAAAAVQAPDAPTPAAAGPNDPPHRAPSPPAPAPPPPHEWWKGTVHAKSDAQKEAEAAEGTGEWLCVSQRCTGVKNARNAPHCKACGALRRLGTQSIRTHERDTVNDYARRM